LTAILFGKTPCGNMRRIVKSPPKFFERLNFFSDGELMRQGAKNYSAAKGKNAPKIF
jgi:hypothetical protein